MKNKFSIVANKRVFSGVLGAIALCMVSTASAQVTIYNETFNSGYTSSTPLSGQNGWVTNDQSVGSTYTYPGQPAGSTRIGQSDSVGYVSSFSDPNNSSDRVAYLGGLAPNIVPGRAGMVLSHSLPGGSTPNIAFNIDFSVTPSTASGLFSARDTFGLSFRDSLGSTLFTIQMAPPANNAAGIDNIGYTSSNAAAANTAVITLGARYHLTVNINTTAHTFAATLLGTDANNNPISTSIANGIAYDPTLVLSNFAATWQLKNTANQPGSVAGTTAYTNPGANGLYFDNLSVSVPEPSTCAMLGLGLAGVAGLVRSRRVASL